MWRGTLRDPITSSCAILVLLLVSTASGLGRPVHVMASTPAAEALIQSGNAQYVVRFDGPVDHARSRLEILRDGQVVERLHPLLDSAAEVLFASAPAPEPGHYVLHWIVKSVPDQDASEGMIPFSVAQ
jgi:copper resistance protein C